MAEAAGEGLCDELAEGVGVPLGDCFGVGLAEGLELSEALGLAGGAGEGEGLALGEVLGAGPNPGRLDVEPCEEPP